MQELMRHSSLRSTIDVYTQAVTPATRALRASRGGEGWDCNNRHKYLFA